MYRGLIDNLAFVYGFLYKGRGKIPADGMRAIAEGAHTLAAHAPAVLGTGEETRDDLADLAAARKMDAQIEEATVFLTSMEIV
ncbi:MAG: hypothetical protein J6U01_06835 [Clostridia bacterium]|nr:hypothetical protein [Clostridia bacterium]